MFKYALVAALTLAATPTLAQDTKAFNGFFVGAQLGWQQDNLSVDVDGVDLGDFGDFKTDGFNYGGQVGYDFRASNTVVIGAEVSIADSTGKLSFDDGETEVALEVGRTIAVTGRLGYLVDTDALFYVRGGYANAEYTGEDDFDSASGNRDGFTLGLGIEKMLGRNVSARFEYNYSDFGSIEEAFSDGESDFSAKANLNRHALTAGVNFRF